MTEDIMKRRTVRYRKIGGGSLRWNGRIIKPNQVFSAVPEELPTAFLRYIVPVDPESEKAAVTPEQTLALKEAPQQPTSEDSEKVYRMRMKGGGWYDIVNTASGKCINEKSLRKADAEKLLQELIG